MTRLGHDAIGRDVDRDKVDALNRAEPPFYEPGLSDLLRETLATGRLTFSHDPKAVAQASVHFLCVGTPQKRGENSADLQFVDAAVTALLPQLSPGDVVVGKSTVPVGTAEAIAARVSEAEPGATLAWNPEFLREGHACLDTLRPDRLV